MYVCSLRAAGLFLGCVLFLSSFDGTEFGAAEISAARRTETVRLVERTMPSVVSVRTFAKTEPPTVTTHHGSGVILDAQGYILTNSHVLREYSGGEVELADNRVFPYQILAAFPQEDLALVKIDCPESLPFVRMGRSHDLLLGEPALVLGNASELGSSVSTGIISGLHRATNTEFCFLPEVLQTSAAINGGNSGGPLINADGKLIGLVVSKKSDADNIGFAVAVDRIRRTLPTLLAAESRRGIQTGLEFDPMTDKCRITNVVENSPGSKLFQKQDELLEVDGKPLAGSLDFQFRLFRKQPGDALEIGYRRGEEKKSAKLILGSQPGLAAVTVAKTAAGLKFACYAGKWQSWQDRIDSPPIARGIVKEFVPSESPEAKEYFLYVTEGLLKAPAEGVYTFGIFGSGGCRFWIGDRLVAQSQQVEGTGNTGGAIRLMAGLHRVRLEMVHTVGKPELTMWWNGPNIAIEKAPASALFHEP